MRFSNKYRLSRRLDMRRYKFARRAKPRSTRGISVSKVGRHAITIRPSCATNALTPGTVLKTSRLRRIGKHWLSKPDVIVYPDHREICNPATPGGQAEYKYRVLLMWIRQDGGCCNCPYPLALSEATFEHETPRTRARQDDRIAIFNKHGNFIRHLNGASHLDCNSRRGSSGAPIFHGNNCFIERAA